MKHPEWEPVTKQASYNNGTWRLKIIGGWLVKDFEELYDEDNKYLHYINVVFVPDPDHIWKVVELLTKENTK